MAGTTMDTTFNQDNMSNQLFVMMLQILVCALWTLERHSMQVFLSFDLVKVFAQSPNISQCSCTITHHIIRQPHEVPLISAYTSSAASNIVQESWI